jgi:2-keto-3-deoxy-L-rhamnonate aldolase RhmA
MGLARQHTFFQGGNARETMNSLNEEVLIALQIENKEAIENLSELLSVPGIDAAFVGPADLSASFGKPGRSDDPEILSAIDRVIEACEANGVIPGIHTGSVAKARFWAAKGMKMIGFCTDIKLIQQICRTSVQELHAEQ